MKLEYSEGPISTFFGTLLGTVFMAIIWHYSVKNGEHPGPTELWPLGAMVVILHIPIIIICLIIDFVKSKKVLDTHK